MSGAGLDRLADAGLLRRGVELGRLTTYKLGGPARWYAEVGDPGTLRRVADAWRQERPPILVLGRGSNLVIGEGGFPGLVIRLAGAMAEVEAGEEGVEAGGAVPLPVLARAAVEAGWLGLEFYVGIPGSVGGAVRQNAGCHGVETIEVLEAARVLALASGEEGWRTPSEMDLAYRRSNLRPTDVVMAARFHAVRGSPERGRERMREVTRWRKEHQPGGTLNAGSVFKNPPGDAAGRIIDELGLKGLRVGGASVSERHANFFVADRTATPSDVRRLVEEVQRRVEAATGIRLEPEIQLVGEFES